MGLGNLIKREIAITICTVLLISTTFLMFSYSIFKVDKETPADTIKFGDIALRMCVNSLCDKSINNLDNVIGIQKTMDSNGSIVTKHIPIFPTNDPTTAEEWASLTSYTFELTNTGTLDLYVTIILEKDTTATTINEERENPDGTTTITYGKQVDDSEVKIGFGEASATPTIKLYSDTLDSSDNKHKISKNILLKAGETKTYNLYAWLRSDAQNASQGKYFITNITAKGEYLPNGPKTLSAKLLEDNPTISTRTDFSTPFTTNTANTLYKTTENGTDVYYFAGQDTASTPVNNWVKFGKNSSNQDLYWRIIRTNSDGSIRLLYHGTSTATTDAYIGTSEFNTYETSSPKYVGYMYGDTDATLEEARTNTNNSTIKTAIDNWYASNMTSYTKYLSPTAVYCNDRELATGSTYKVANYIKNDTETLIAYLDAEDTKKTIIAAPEVGGIGSKFDYASYTRLNTNKTPTYDCTNDNDKFTVDASTGNGKLTYPIALMTADEISYAGGVNGTNAPMWYYTNSSFESSTGAIYWWSLSPVSTNHGNARSWRVIGSAHPGHLNDDFVNISLGVRPTVSLKTCTLYSTGNGTSETPYEIVETSSGC